MSEHEEKSNKPTVIDNAELAKLSAIVNAAVSAAMKEGASQSTSMAQAITEALIEARKPYISPQDIANRESARKSSREQAARQKRTKEAEQSACLHVKGSNPNSFRSDPFDSSIAKMVLDTKEVIGICTNCNKVFSSLFEEDVKWLRAKSSNQTAMAGAQDRYFDDPKAAQRARLGLDQKEIFVDSEGNLIDYDPRKTAAAK